VFVDSWDEVKAKLDGMRKNKEQINMMQKDVISFANRIERETVEKLKRVVNEVIKN
jgi:DNA-directed RNA polymerase subunit F